MLYSLSHVHRSPPAFLFLFCEIVSYYIVLADLEPVMILLPLTPKCWCYSFPPRCWTPSVLAVSI